jgi:hypothetical protein
VLAKPGCNLETKVPRTSPPDAEKRDHPAARPAQPVVTAAHLKCFVQKQLFIYQYFT